MAVKYFVWGTGRGGVGDIHTPSRRAGAGVPTALLRKAHSSAEAHLLQMQWPVKGTQVERGHEEEPWRAKLRPVIVCDPL